MPATKAATPPVRAKRRRPSRKDGLSSGGAARIGERRKEQAEIEKQEPLRRRILASLSESPGITKDLAEELGADRSSVSRLLKEFRETGLVFFEGRFDDRREVEYRLSEAGEAALNRHVAFGPREKKKKVTLDQESQVRLMRAALDRGVRIRREANRVEEAAPRLRGVVREAEKIGAHDVALEAMAELAKTARQNRRPDAQDDVSKCLDGLIGRFNAIALGNDENYGAEFAMPAAAHLKYTLGRAGSRRGEDLVAREAHLIAACSLYGQLVKNSRPPAKTEWFRRQAWSVICLGSNLRKQTELEKALRSAIAAKQCFDILEDEYGQARCFFMFGFCLRLLGEFREAFVCFEQALDIAARKSFERVRADTLMQMGEVQRCLGSLDESLDLLDDARARAARMDLLVTQAFAQSALGAVEFQRDELGAARGYFAGAQELFEAVGHREGKALNARREAAVVRKVAIASSSPNYAAVERLIHSAEEGYQGLQSPAGLAACVIEEGRVSMLRKRGRLSPVIERLTALLMSPTQRRILELDPWVPRLLNQFANDAEDERLIKLSAWVLEEAQKTLAERGAQSVERIATVMDIEPEEEGEIDPLAAEMGGEARRDLDSSEAVNTALIGAETRELQPA